MSWYRDYKEQWKEIIDTVAAEEHRTTQMLAFYRMSLRSKELQCFQQYSS